MKFTQAIGVYKENNDYQKLLENLNGIFVPKTHERNMLLGKANILLFEENKIENSVNLRSVSDLIMLNCNVGIFMSNAFIS